MPPSELVVERERARAEWLCEGKYLVGLKHGFGLGLATDYQGYDLAAGQLAESRAHFAKEYRALEDIVMPPPDAPATAGHSMLDALADRCGSEGVGTVRWLGAIIRRLAAENARLSREYDATDLCRILNVAEEQRAALKAENAALASEVERQSHEIASYDFEDSEVREIVKKTLALDVAPDGLITDAVAALAARVAVLVDSMNQIASVLDTPIQAEATAGVAILANIDEVGKIAAAALDATGREKA